ncbi:MAG: Flp pilus assembly protein CpaB [Anaerolineae bacterium]|jgi:pilus assembly protein CpaB
MRRGRILILLGLILAIGTAAAVYVIIQTMEPQPEPVDMVDVVVATQPIPEQESVEGRLAIEPRPQTAVPAEALTSIDEADGMLAAIPIRQGDIIYSELLISPVEAMQKGELGKLVEPGSLAIAFPIDELSSVSYGIQPGDHIDVLMTFFFIDLDQETQVKEPLCAPLCPAPEGQQEAELTDQFPRLATQLTLQDIEILGVGRWIIEETPAEEQDNQARTGEPVQVQLPEYVTLMVTPQDALVLKLAREYGASIDLAVRAQDDAQQFVTQQVTLDYILARFGVALPAKQPYSLEFIETVRPQTEQ